VLHKFKLILVNISYDFFVVTFSLQVFVSVTFPKIFFSDKCQPTALAGCTSVTDVQTTRRYRYLQ